MVTFSIVRKQYKRRLTGNIQKALLIQTCGPESLGCKTSSVSKMKPKGNSAWERWYHKPKGTSCINKVYLCKFYNTLAHRGFHSGKTNSVHELNFEFNCTRSTRAFSLVSCLNVPYSLDTDQTLMHTENYNMPSPLTPACLIHLWSKGLGELSSNSRTQNPFC